MRGIRRCFVNIVNIKEAVAAGTLPTHAGPIRLHFVWHGELPFDPCQFIYPNGRKELEITYDSRLEFHALCGGKQFLLVFPAIADMRAWGVFGGFDESPFHTLLEDTAVVAFLDGGEEAFYAYLKPPIVASLESAIARKASRQGDVWAMPLGVRLGDLPRLASAGECEWPMRFGAGIHHPNLAGHWISGGCFFKERPELAYQLRPDLWKIPESEFGSFILAVGRMEEIGHLSIEFGDEIHLITRSRGISSRED